MPQKGAHPLQMIVILILLAFYLMKAGIIVSAHLVFPDLAGSGGDLAIKRLDKHPACRGWQIGPCQACQRDRQCFIHEAFDREGQSHWLYFGPWSQWERVGALWSHLSWINETMISLSPLLRILGPILPAVDWTGFEEGFMGSTLRAPGTPFLESVSQEGLRLENLVQLTGFLRLLASETGRQQACQTREILEGMELDAQALVDKVKALIPLQAPFCRWQAFYLRNAKSLSHSQELTLSLSFGPYVTHCFSIAANGGLQINQPFFLSEEVAGMDLCRLLWQAKEAPDQDRQYFIDFYYNRKPPSHFFTLLAHHHMTCLLQALDDRREDEGSRAQILSELADLARCHDGFRAPVPSWYLA